MRDATYRKLPWSDSKGANSWLGAHTRIGHGRVTTASGRLREAWGDDSLWLAVLDAMRSAFPDCRVALHSGAANDIPSWYIGAVGGVASSSASALRAASAMAEHRQYGPDRKSAYDERAVDFPTLYHGQPDAFANAMDAVLRPSDQQLRVVILGWRYPRVHLGVCRAERNRRFDLGGRAVLAALVPRILEWVGIAEMVGMQPFDASGGCPWVEAFIDPTFLLSGGTVVHANAAVRSLEDCRATLDTAAGHRICVGAEFFDRAVAARVDTGPIAPALCPIGELLALGLSTRKSRSARGDHSRRCAPMSLARSRLSGCNLDAS